MAAANELDNTLSRSQALLDVLNRKNEQERLGWTTNTETFEFLTCVIERTAVLAAEFAAARKSEKSAFPLRARAVNLAARYLRIIETIDRQNILGKRHEE